MFDIAELREVTAYDELELDTLGDRKTALVLLLALLGGGGVFAYLKLVKNKPKTKGNDSLDDYDYGEEDSEEWETEDEESEEPDADGGSTEEDDEDSVK